MSVPTRHAARNIVRTFNNHVLNPVMLHFAGRRHWYCAVVRHTGRRSGKHFATPVVAELVTGDTIIVPLPYGTGVDWLRNVMAAGGTVIMLDGMTYDVTDPEIIGAVTALPQLSVKRRRVFTHLAIDNFLKVKVVE